MIAAVIVLSVVALALGVYIVVDILRGKKVADADTPAERGDPQKTAEEVPPVAPENESATAEAPETETADESDDGEPNDDNGCTDIDKNA